MSTRGQGVVSRTKGKRRELKKGSVQINEP
ncbi:uncharacterized protein G2W53_030276 [Senna tora]|uniref:Uncharacterized protein n=1 Tax=Senna tora TaxID=362788 RepID=A0A834WBG3_9FABA|nr:uncharacterized protein G2W53_030276 [Senna tora]